MDSERNCEAITFLTHDNPNSHAEEDEQSQVQQCSSPSKGESEREEEVGTGVTPLARASISACPIADQENEVALGCNAETPEYPCDVLFSELPDLVMEEIMKHLDTPAKLALREVCRLTKRLIDNSKLLNLFCLEVTSNDELCNLVKFYKIFPEAKWKRFIFTEKRFTNYELFPSFVSIFCDHISTLQLRHFDAGLAQILFLSSCETLKCLKIGEMDLRENPALVIASDKSLKAKCPKLLDLFTELKELSIGIIFFNDVKHLPFYQTFLQRCRKLERLNVPRTQGPPTISWEALKTIQLKYIITPIKEYLQKKPITSPLKSNIEVLNVEGLFSRHFPAVAEACVQIGSPTLFENVNEKHVKYLFTHEGDILQKIVSLHEKIDDRRPITKWENLQRLFVRSSRCDIRNEYPEFIAYPNLKYLTIVLDSKSKEDHNFAMLHRLIQLLVFQPRENLMEFVMQWPGFSHDTPRDYIRASHFVGNFLNLTKLHVSGWIAPDDDFILVFEVLCKLKELIIEECQNLTDWGILGPSELPMPVIMNLKDLKRMEIRNRNNPGYLTDACCNAFKNMRLTYFLLDSFHVTLKGYETLAEGEFAASIRRLPVPYTLPRGLAAEDFVYFVASNFPNVIL